MGIKAYLCMLRVQILQGFLWDSKLNHNKPFRVSRIPGTKTHEICQKDVSDSFV